MSEEKISGGCFCGSVRYSFRSEPMWPGVCYCAACRKLGGGASGWFGVPISEAMVEGKVAFFAYPADSGNTVERGVCEKCRSPVFNRNSRLPEVRIFAASTLDDPAMFVPRMSIWASSAPPWLCIDPGLPKFDKMPVPKGEGEE